MAVWELANYIQKIYYGWSLTPKEFKPEDLKNAFEGVGAELTVPPAGST